MTPSKRDHKAAPPADEPIDAIAVHLQRRDGSRVLCLIPPTVSADRLPGVIATMAAHAANEDAVGTPTPKQRAATRKRKKRGRSR